MATLVEYIWIDGQKPTKQLRSKTKILREGTLKEWAGTKVATRGAPQAIAGLSTWGADGSSTMQALGSDSDVGLVPVCVVQDPLRGAGCYLALCEVTAPDGTVHPSNTRSGLREVLAAGAAQNDPLFGFEQEYTFLRRDGQPLGFPVGGFPAPQGPYYCAVGTGNIVGRGPYEAFMKAALAAGLCIEGCNYEVMPGQAEFQMGTADPLTACDHLWLGRWLLQRICEEHDLIVSLDAKPALGDWNGAGMHTNFSTRQMRAQNGMEHIVAACEALGRKRAEHLAVYGHGYELRLTGRHETCSHRDYRFGVADRTASVRIPRHVAQAGCGYLEDRRPNANADPYEVAERMLATVCGRD